MATIKHPHLYKRFHFPSGKAAFRCVKPGCTHYSFPEFYIGQVAECWGCQEVITIEKYHTDKAKPRCFNCQKRAKPATALSLLKKKLV